MTPAEPIASRSPDTPGAGFAVDVEAFHRFVWPAAGPLTSYFGRLHPTGIDIALDANFDSPVRASSGGAIAFAGGDTCCGYGLYVVVDSGAGWIALYGHLSKLLVETGQDVSQGDILGLGGSTGSAEGKHLHFEVVHDGLYVDPLRVLPAQQSPVDGSRVRAASCPAGSISLDSTSVVTLSFPAVGLLGYEVADVSLEPAGSGLVEARKKGTAAVTLQVHTPEAASEQQPIIGVDVTLARGEAQTHVTCSFSVQTMPSFPERNTPRWTPTPAATIPATRTATAAPAPGKLLSVTATPRSRFTTPQRGSGSVITPLATPPPATGTPRR